MSAPEKSLINQFSNFPGTNVDLQGGTLMEVKQREEIDESDGCLVQITEYHILSADKKEELIKTCRRKLKIECNQISKRTEITNGKEAKVEETSQHIIGDLSGFHKPTISGNSEQLMLDDDDENMALSAVLAQSQEGFLNMISEQRNQLIAMFPDLFSEMRTESQLLPPVTTEVETIINPDGSKTTRMKSSRAYSSRFSKEEMYINGVKQESKSKFRAFMEYKGPEGGFVVNLSDNQQLDLSEDEGDDRSQISELSEDASSDLISMGTVDIGEKAAPDKAKKRWEKAWHAAKELVDSEQRYVDKLRLLDESFKKRVVEGNVIGKDKIQLLFANVSSLYQFHDTHLLPALMASCRDWQSTHKISDVLRKRAPFLKMYSEYTNNYKTATKVFEDCFRKKRKFAQIVQEVERTRECENLPLVSHLICPVQRVMRYQLLLQEYKKHLQPADPDYKDTEEALSLVLQAAGHANEMMRKLDRYKNVLEVQEQIGNAIILVSPSRELIKKGKIWKVSSSSDKTEERLLFLFNDLLLLASERTIPGFGKYKVRAVFDAILTQICEGDNLERENSFYVRGAGSQAGPSRCVELYADTEQTKSEWIEAIWNVISESINRKDSFVPSETTKSTASNGQSKVSSHMCSKCGYYFSFVQRGTVCVRCNTRFCKKCFGRYRTMDRSRRICDGCIIQNNGSVRGNNRGTENNKAHARVDPLAIPADKGEILHFSFVKFKGSLNKTVTRYFVVRKDFCLYSYKTEKDQRALAMLPLPGCEVKMSGEKLTFTIKQGERSYSVTVKDEKTQIKWMAVLDLAANAAIKVKRPR